MRQVYVFTFPILGFALTFFCAQVNAAEACANKAKADSLWSDYEELKKKPITSCIQFARTKSLEAEACWEKRSQEMREFEANKSAIMKSISQLCPDYLRSK